MEFMSALGSQEDAYCPSLFELVAQEKLKELLQPAVQYILAVGLFHLHHPYKTNKMIHRSTLNVTLVYC